jgi:hypothetical protein
LSDVLESRGIKCILDNRILGARGAAKSALQGLIAVQAGSQFIKPMSAGEDGDEGVVELLGRTEFKLLLRDLDLLIEQVDQLQFLQSKANGGQGSVW